jgi:C-terminal processing protease CtpA/Prc
MYSSLKRLNIPKKILTILVGSSIFTFKQTNFFSFNNNNKTFSDELEENTNNKINSKSPLQLNSNDKKNSDLKENNNKDKDNYNKDNLNLINMIYLPIQYSFFFFYETLSNKFAYCNNDSDIQDDKEDDNNNKNNFLEKKKLYLGCSIRYNEELRGMRIINIKTDSPAERSGLKVNDVILEIDGKEILSINDYKIAINSNKDNLKNFKVAKIDSKSGERIIENIKIYLEYEL